MHPSLLFCAKRSCGSGLLDLERNMLLTFAMCRKFFTILLLLTLVSCAPGKPRQPLTAVTGKVSSGGMPLAGIEVDAYPVTTSTLVGPAPFRSAVTATDGLFRLALPPGEYYLLARGDGHFCYYGRNPVAIPGEGLSGLNLGLVAAQAGAPRREAGIAEGVAGYLLHEGQPLAGAVVQVYTDLASRLKGMGYAMGGPTDEDGYFEVPLPAGTYYLLARLRQGGGGMTGPLRAGDFIGYYAGNPLRVEEGRVGRIAIPMLEVPEKVDRLAGTLFGQTAVRGRILRRDGSPVAGVRAILYSDPQMLNRPLYVSQPTAADGTFVLSFPQGGTYYLAARNTLGGAPSPGDLYGTFDGSPDHALQVADGEQKSGIEIVVEEMW